MFVYFAFKKHISDSTENLIYTPGAFLLAVAICSSFWIKTSNRAFQQNNFRSIIWLSIASLVNGALLFVFSDLLTLILERFFRLEEHYSFTDLFQKWTNQWYVLFAGAFIFWVYQILIRFDYIQKNFRLNERKIQSLENEIATANLQSLRAELNPHFLYNAMNSIAMMVRVKKYSESISMIANLNELLRISLNKSEEQLIPLEDELKILDKYLQVELIRFGDRVELIYETNSDTLQAKVPQLILQPIVENTFKHGMSSDLGKQRIIFKSKKLNGQLILSLINSSNADISIDLSHKPDNHKVGLQNVKNRLIQLYGGQFKFQLE